MIKNKQGCGRKFFVRRAPDGMIVAKDDKTNLSPKVLLVCGDNLSHKLCPQCEEEKELKHALGLDYKDKPYRNRVY